MPPTWAACSRRPWSGWAGWCCTSVKAGSLSDADIEARVAERTAAKKARDFGLSDRIRDGLLEQGIILEDTKSGVRWKRK